MQLGRKYIETNNRQGDLFLILLTLLLVGFGLVMVLSSSAFFAKKHIGDQYFFFTRQTIFAIAGFFIMYAVSRFNYQNYKNKKLVYLAMTIVSLLLLAVLSPSLGQTTLGARRWLALGPIHLQPSELAKPLLIIYLAFSLTKEREKNEGFIFGYLIHLILPLFVMVLIIAEPDIGTVVLIFSVSLLMLFVGGSPIKYPIGVILSLSPFIVLMFYLYPHSLERIRMWINQLLFLGSEQDYSLLCYQIRESLISFGSGNSFGLGLGEGTLKMFFLPQAHSDFILATIGQELGFAGTMTFFLFFALLIIRGYQIAFSVPDTFGFYLAFGITSMLLMQFLINTGVVIGLLPPKGIALPMISYGGSSLIVTLILIGILINISKFTIKRTNRKRGGI